MEVTQFLNPFIWFSCKQCFYYDKGSRHCKRQRMRLYRTKRVVRLIGWQNLRSKSSSLDRPKAVWLGWKLCTAGVGSSLSLGMKSLTHTNLHLSRYGIGKRYREEREWAPWHVTHAADSCDRTKLKIVFFKYRNKWIDILNLQDVY